MTSSQAETNRQAVHRPVRPVAMDRLREAGLNAQGWDQLQHELGLRSRRESATVQAIAPQTVAVWLWARDAGRAADGGIKSN